MNSFDMRPRQLFTEHVSVSFQANDLKCWVQLKL